MRYCCVGYDNEQESTESGGVDNVENQPNDPVSDTESDNLPLASFIGEFFCSEKLFPLVFQILTFCEVFFS